VTHTSAQFETLKSKTKSAPPTANPVSSMHMAKEEGKMATVLLQVVYNGCDSCAKDLN
jgi:hypothetical protein